MSYCFQIAHISFRLYKHFLPVIIKPGLFFPLYGLFFVKPIKLTGGLYH